MFGRLQKLSRLSASEAFALVRTKNYCVKDCVRLWKTQLQKLADETGLVLHVHHYPPGTSNWNRIEHRMFCHITQNWRGRPLTDRLAIVELIGATTTKTGLKVECALDTRIYEKGVKVSAAEMAALNIIGEDFHPEWNYTINPRLPSNS